MEMPRDPGLLVYPEPPADWDLARVRADFPILAQEARGKPLVYLDNAATTQKPARVIDAVREYYERDNANVHRGLHLLSERATRAFEAARVKVQRFLGAAEANEIIFVRGATEALNLVAASYARPRLRAGDEILVTVMEHHSNIVPWQLVCDQTGATLKVVDVDETGALDLSAFRALLSERTKLVCAVHVSNALGTINPIAEIAEAAKACGAAVVVDGAQAAPHVEIDVVSLGVDFYAISGHKVYGPTGIGALYGRGELLRAMPPYQGGGEMIRSVTFQGTTYADPPSRFEAGTPNIAGAIGLGAALDYLGELGLARVAAWEEALLRYGTARLQALPGLTLHGTAPHKAGVLAFVMDGVHAHDIGTIVDQQGVAIRAGHHCAQPLMQRFGFSATARASLALYNTPADIDALVDALETVRKIFAPR